MLELRRKIYNQLDPKVWTGDGMSPLNAGILIAVLISIFIVILQSEPVIFAAYTSFFIALNVADYFGRNVFAVLGQDWFHQRCKQDRA